MERVGLSEVADQVVMVVAIVAGAPHAVGILATEISESLLFREGADPLAVITRARDSRALGAIKQKAEKFHSEGET
jgi:hypothetical protein